MKFNFGNIVVVDSGFVGVIVKSWEDHTYDVYVRSYNRVEIFKEKDIEHYIFNKELSEEELEFYEN